MDGICNLLKPVIDSESKNETLRNLLLSCADQRAFTKCSGGFSSFVGIINGKLNEPGSRNDGLLLLQTFLPQCPMELLNQHATTWIQLCLKGAASGRTAQLSFIVLKMLLNLSDSVSELSRHVSSIVVPNFAEIIHQGISAPAYLDALECLELCMTKYNGACGPHRKVIDGFLMSLLDYSGPNQLKVFWNAARCMALLPQTGGGGVGGVQYKLSWAVKHKQLCRTIHMILDDLYSDTNELQVSLMGGMLEGFESLPLPQIDDADPILRTQRLAIRLLAVSGCLQAMLVSPYPVPKNVSVSSITNLICRGLAVNGSSIGPCNTTHTLALTAELPKVHLSLLKLLESLILLCRSNLLPFSALICRLCIQTLKWTLVEDWPYGTERPYKHLRTQAYQVLKIWCGTAKGGSGVEDVTQQLMDVALPDIFSEKDSVSLTIGLNKKNKNQRRSKGTPSPAGSTVSRDGVTLNESANKDVCVAALQAFTAMLMAASSRVQASVHKTLQDTVVNVMLKATIKSGAVPIPYSCSAPRLELYRFLLQLVLDGHSVWPAPTNIATKLFAHGLHDQDVQISMFCGMALSAVEKIIHPAYPSLHITPSEKEVDACMETSPQDTSANAGLPAPNSTLAKDLARASLGDSENDLTDAASLTPNIKREKRSVGVSTWLAPAGNSENAVLEKRQSLSQDEKVAAVGLLESQKAIDLTNSDISDDEISEVPCEIDLADSEDEIAGSVGEKSNVSMSSQATVNTPMTHEQKIAKMTDIITSSVDVDIIADSVMRAMEKGLGKTETCNESSANSLSKETKVSEGSGAIAVNGTPATNGNSEVENGDVSIEGSKNAVEEEEDEVEQNSASKKAKLDDTMEFPSDEDSMLMSFVDVTRDEENEDI